MFTIGDLLIVGVCDTCEHQPIALAADLEEFGEDGKYQPCDACALCDSAGMWRQGADAAPHPHQIEKYLAEVGADE